jgi:hypothetical protein
MQILPGEEERNSIASWGKEDARHGSRHIRHVKRDSLIVWGWDGVGREA